MGSAPDFHVVVAQNQYLVTGFLLHPQDGPAARWVRWEMDNRDRVLEPVGAKQMEVFAPEGAWHLAALVASHETLDAVASFAQRAGPGVLERVTLFFLSEEDAERHLAAWAERGLGDVDFSVTPEETRFHRRYGQVHNDRTYLDAKARVPARPLRMRVTMVAFLGKAGREAAAALVKVLTGAGTGTEPRWGFLGGLGALRIDLEGEEAERFFLLALAWKGFRLPPTAVDDDGHVRTEVEAEALDGVRVSVKVVARFQTPREAYFGPQGRTRAPPARQRTVGILRKRFGAHVG